MVSAWSSSHRLVLGQVAVDKKSNEMQRVRATEAELPLPKGVRANARCRLRQLEGEAFALYQYS